MRAALLQIASPPDDPRTARIARVVERITRLDPCDLIVLPELWATGYFAFDRYETDARALDEDPALATLAATARDRRCHLLAGSVVERTPAGTLRNTAVLLGPDGTRRHTYSKHHLFGYESREATLLEAGDSVGVATTPLGTFGVTTCYDVRFPELYRLLVSQGAEVVLIPSAWPAARLGHWRLLVQARALENQCYVLACNAAGAQGDVVLAGHSLVVAPDGEVLAEGGEEECDLVVDVDVAEVGRARADFPALASRRITVAAG